MSEISTREIAHVYFWQNGMAMVFDQYGEQMPDYQGPTAEMREKILRDAPPSATITDDAVWPGPQGAKGPTAVIPK